MITPHFARPAAALIGLLGPFAATATEFDAERQAFREVYPQAELGVWQPAAAESELLADYPLWPDLRAAWLRARLAQVDERQITAFLERYTDLKPARELRYRYALMLGQTERHEDYLAVYRRHYGELGNARLDCLALRAELAQSDAQQVFAKARSLWLIGQSQVDACDPLFDALRAAGLLDESLYRQRYRLAIEARELGLARHLARSLPAQYQRDAAAWTSAYGQPQKFLENHDPAAADDTYRQQLLAALERLAREDPLTARQLWSRIKPHYPFSGGERAAALRHLALWQARHHRDDAYRQLIALDGAAVNAEVLRWRVRTALRRRDWSDVLLHIAELPPAERALESWQFWRAVALGQRGDTAGADALFATLSNRRSYYGFLAADASGTDYAWRHAPLPADEPLLARLAARPELVRARELFLVGLEGRGRSEWNAAVQDLPAPARVQAAILANRWGWHSQVIATLAEQSRYDDLTLRYPLPYADAFTRYAKAADIPRSWAFGIARSESLFMRDVRSPAGALGVMQLTLSTGRRTAQAISLPYSGYTTLLDTDSNIRLGTSFLGRMRQRFSDNQALATAAYNAGPRRVETWLPDDTELDARIWIETIPYRETRRYVQRVMTADAIFHWRLHGSLRRVSDALPPVPAAKRPGKVAANQPANR